MGVEEGINGHTASLGYDHGLSLDHLREVQTARVAQFDHPSKTKWIKQSNKERERKRERRIWFPSIRATAPFGGLGGATVTAIEVLGVTSLLNKYEHSCWLFDLCLSFTFLTGLVIPSLWALVGWTCRGRKRGGTWGVDDFCLK